MILVPGKMAIMDDLPRLRPQASVNNMSKLGYGL
jgi:hypothetical protein